MRLETTQLIDLYPKSQHTSRKISLCRSSFSFLKPNKANKQKVKRGIQSYPLPETTIKLKVDICSCFLFQLRVLVVFNALKEHEFTCTLPTLRLYNNSEDAEGVMFEGPKHICNGFHFVRHADISITMPYRVSYIRPPM